MSPAAPFKPTVLDVLVVRAMLNASLPIPAELVDTIIEQAEYWAHSQTQTDHPSTAGSRAQIIDDSHSGDRFLLRSRPLGFPRLPVPDAKAYCTVLPEPSKLESEYEAEDFQRWINSPTPTLKNPCRRIVFTIRSHDQGWGGGSADRGSHNHSWTWFTVGLERFDAGQLSPNASLSTDERAPGTRDRPSFHPDALRPVYPPIKMDPDSMTDTNSGPQRYQYDHSLHPNPNRQIQSNLVASKKTKEYVIEWSCMDNIHPESPEADALAKEGRGKGTGTGEFVRSLKLGDVVTVWGHARFPGWMNVVEMAQMEIYWAV